MQQQHVQQAAANPALLAHNNGGRPAIAATPRPAAFNAPGVIGAHGAAPPAAANANRAPGRNYGAQGGQNGNRGYGAQGARYGNRGYGAQGGQTQAPGGYARPQQAVNGRPQGQKSQQQKAAKPRKIPGENGRREPETALR